MQQVLVPGYVKLQTAEITGPSLIQQIMQLIKAGTLIGLVFILQIQTLYLQAELIFINRLMAEQT